MSERTDRDQVTGDQTRDQMTQGQTIPGEMANVGTRPDGSPAGDGLRTGDITTSPGQGTSGITVGPQPDDQGGNGHEAPLVSDVDGLRRRWETVQAGFVDEPRRAVEQADGLVAEVIQEMVSTFSTERGRLEEQWSGGNDVSTEDLRLSLQRYRSFFNRLLHT